MQFNIGDFLSKFKTLVPDGKTIKDNLIVVVKEETGIILSLKEIFFHNNTIFIKTSPLIKNELFIRKQKIISKIKERIADKQLLDIR